MTNKLNRGTIKVMHGRGGVVRVQEDLGDSIKVYSLEDWNKEQDRRANGGKAPKLGAKPKAKVVALGEAGNAPEPKAKKPRAKKAK
jgi:hypothetical protein